MNNKYDAMDCILKTCIPVDLRDLFSSMKDTIDKQNEEINILRSRYVNELVSEAEAALKSSVLSNMACTNSSKQNKMDTYTGHNDDKIRDNMIGLIHDILTVSAVYNGEYIETSVNVEEIVDYLISNGATILPYLIGTKLYHNVVLEDEPQEFEVVGFYCEDKPKLVHTEFEFNGKRYSRTYDIDDEGQSYFLSKDDALQSKNAKTD